MLAYASSMPRPRRSDDETAVLFVRGMPRELLYKLKGAAALQGRTLGQYIQELCAAHVQELQLKGKLPKSK